MERFVTFILNKIHVTLSPVFISVMITRGDQPKNYLREIMEHLIQCASPRLYQEIRVEKSPDQKEEGNEGWGGGGLDFDENHDS